MSIAIDYYDASAVLDATAAVQVPPRDRTLPDGDGDCPRCLRDRWWSSPDSRIGFRRSTIRWLREEYADALPMLDFRKGMPTARPDLSEDEVAEAWARVATIARMLTRGSARVAVA